MAHETRQTIQEEWVTFPGGELEGKRPKALCQRAARPKSGSRHRAYHGAPGTSSVVLPVLPGRVGAIEPCSCWSARHSIRGTLQVQLPFEPVNEPRLAKLKWIAPSAQLRSSESAASSTSGVRHKSPHATRSQMIAAGLRTRQLAGDNVRAMDMAIHAAELQLPESWLPFVVSR